jgi:hypothetical protein
MEAWRARLATV